MEVTNLNMRMDGYVVARIDEQRKMLVLRYRTKYWVLIWLVVLRLRICFLDTGHKIFSWPTLILSLIEFYERAAVFFVGLLIFVDLSGCWKVPEDYISA